MYIKNFRNRFYGEDEFLNKLAIMRKIVGKHNLHYITVIDQDIVDRMREEEIVLHDRKVIVITNSKYIMNAVKAMFKLSKR